MKKGDEITFKSAEFLYPNPIDSKVKEPNPDYHQPIVYRDGKFWNEYGDPLSKKEIPESVLDAVKNLAARSGKPTIVKEGTELEIRDVAAGKPLLDERTTVKVKAEAAKKARAAAKKKPRRKTKARKSTRKKAA